MIRCLLFILFISFNCNAFCNDEKVEGTWSLYFSFDNEMDLKSVLKKIPEPDFKPDNKYEIAQEYISKGYVKYFRNKMNQLINLIENEYRIIHGMIENGEIQYGDSKGELNNEGKFGEECEFSSMANIKYGNYLYRMLTYISVGFEMKHSNINHLEELEKIKDNKDIKKHYKYFFKLYNQLANNYKLVEEFIDDHQSSIQLIKQNEFFINEIDGEFFNDFFKFYRKYMNCIIETMELVSKQSKSKQKLIEKVSAKYFPKNESDKVNVKINFNTSSKNYTHNEGNMRETFSNIFSH